MFWVEAKPGKGGRLVGPGSSRSLTVAAERPRKAGLNEKGTESEAQLQEVAGFTHTLGRVGGWSDLQFDGILAAIGKNA